MFVITNRVDARKVKHYPSFFFIPYFHTQKKLKIYAEHNVWWVVIIIVLSMGIAYFQYYTKKPTPIFSSITRLSLFSIRCLVLSLIGILLLDFYSRFLKNEYIKPNVVLAIDNSRSMVLAKDSQQVKTFLTEKLPPFIDNLKNQFDVQVITFGEKLKVNPDNISFQESKTNAENLFYEIPQILPNKPISAMIMLTDGIFNEGVHPISLADNVNYPIYIIACGDTNSYKDIAIKKIIHNKNVFIGNDFMVEVILNASKVREEKVTLSISENKERLASKEIIVNSDQREVISVPFQLHAGKSGYHTYRVDVSYVENEKNLQNNTAYFVVNVIENKIKVLILYSQPHPDISAIRQSLIASEQYETEAYYDYALNKNLYDFDVIIYHSPETNSPIFYKCLKSHIPMMIISNNLMALKDEFLNVSQYLVQQTNEIEVTLDASFTSFTLNDDYKDISPHLPIILAPYGSYSPKGEYDVLYYQKINNVLTELPLFFFTKLLNIKYAVFLGDGIWRWKMANYQLKQNHEWFNHLIMQTIRYLSIKRDKSPFKVHIPATINENEPLQITAELVNETMQYITEPDVFIVLEDSSKHQYKYVFNKSTSNYFLNAGILPAGQYTYKAYTQYKGKEYAQSGKLQVLPLSIETNQLTAQHHLLKALTKKTNGKFHSLSTIDDLYAEISHHQDIKTIVTQHESYQYWIDNKWWFVVLTLLAISEWIIRRWHGII